MRLSRRNFHRSSAFGRGLSCARRGAVAPACVRRGAGRARILVVLHMRGACDGLNLVCPANDPHLITSRPIELRVAESGDKAGSACRGDARYRLAAASRGARACRAL